jgi:ubiquinone/menaquinone biosynthesis C-methylase UbiE
MKYYRYWNDLEEEKQKPYFIQDKSDPKLLNYCEKETNLRRCFEDALRFPGEAGIGEIKGRVLDVGAGVAWSSALMSRIPTVERVIGIDYSEHRIKTIAPLVFEQLHGLQEKFESILGDFLELNWQPEEFNTVVFCQALYMFPNLKRTLDKVKRILAGGGLLVVACERIVPSYPRLSYPYLFRKLKRVIKGRVDATGNHGYDDREYREAIESAGFSFFFQELDYILLKREGYPLAGNYFGKKI